MIVIDRIRTPQELVPAIDFMFTLSAVKIRSIEDTWAAADGAPVFTVDGQVHLAWVDGVDAGVSVRVRAAAVRRDG